MEHLVLHGLVCLLVQRTVVHLTTSVMGLIRRGLIHAVLLVKVVMMVHVMLITTVPEHVELLLSVMELVEWALVLLKMIATVVQGTTVLGHVSWVFAQTVTHHTQQMGVLQQVVSATQLPVADLISTQTAESAHVMVILATAMNGLTTVRDHVF